MDENELRRLKGSERRSAAEFEAAKARILGGGAHTLPPRDEEDVERTFVAGVQRLTTRMKALRTEAMKIHRELHVMGSHFGSVKEMTEDTHESLHGALGTLGVDLGIVHSTIDQELLQASHRGREVK